VLETWPPEWCTLDLAELDKKTVQKRKDDAKHHVTQLVERRHNEKVAAEVRATRGVAQAAPEQKKATEVATTQIAEAEIVQAEEGQAVSIGQEVEDTNLA